MPTAWSDEITIAVMDFQGSNKDTAWAVTENFLTNLAMSGKLSIVERANLEKAMKEIGVTQSFSSEQQVKVGKLVGAKKIIVGSVTDLEGTITVNCRMTDVETSKIDKSMKKSGPKGNLAQLVDALSNAFHQKLTGEFIPGVEGGQEYVTPYDMGVSPDTPVKPIVTTPTTPTTPTYVPPTKSKPSEILLQEDFSAPTAVFVENEVCKYRNGEYYMSYHKEDGNLYYTWTGEAFDNFVMTVKARKVRGLDNWGYGLLFRHQGTVDNSYEFAISGNGMYYFGKVVNGKYEDIIPWKESSAIHQGNDVNYLKISADGNKYTFYINNQEIDSITDNAFSSGKVGFLTYSDVETAFDDFMVSTVGSAPVQTVSFTGKKVLFAADFTNASDKKFVQDQHTAYSGGEYVMTYRKKEGNLYYSWVAEEHAVSDFILEVTARKVGGMDNWGYGVVYRLQDIDNAYEFGVSGNGMYYVGKTSKGDYKDLVPWTTSDAVQLGDGGTNRLRVECRGAECSFFVNGAYLTSVTDYTFSSGRFGFLDFHGVEAAFDDLKVYAAN